MGDATASASRDESAAVQAEVADLRDACESATGAAFLRQSASEAEARKAGALDVPTAHDAPLAFPAALAAAASSAAPASRAAPVAAARDSNGGGAAVTLLRHCGTVEAVELPASPASGRVDGALKADGAQVRAAWQSATAHVGPPRAAVADAGAASATMTAPSQVYIKVGAGRYLDWPFDWASIKDTCQAGALLAALASNAIFAGCFKGPEPIASCTIVVLRHSARLAHAHPDAGEETVDNIEELTLGRSLGSVAEAIGALGAKLFVHVRLPPAVGAESAHATAGAPSLLTAWRSLLACATSVADVCASAASVAASAVRDFSLSVADEAVMWSCPVTTSILQKPLPYDTSNQHKHAVMLELVDPVDGSATTRALNERLWSMLQPAFGSTAQRTSAILLTGVSGAGKTKAVLDIGSNSAFVIMARIYEQGVLTDAWQLLEEVTEQLHAQTWRRSGLAAGSRCLRMAVPVWQRFSSQSVCEMVAWINYFHVPDQPVVLAHISKANLGVDVLQGVVGDSTLHAPRDASDWWPSRIRHWPNGTAHPQSQLLPPPDMVMQPSRVVTFANGDVSELHAAAAEAAASGRYKIVREAKHQLVVEFGSIVDAFFAVSAALTAADGAAVAGSAAGVAGGLTATFR